MAYCDERQNVSKRHFGNGQTRTTAESKNITNQEIWSRRENNHVFVQRVSIGLAGPAAPGNKDAVMNSRHCKLFRQMNNLSWYTTTPTKACLFELLKTRTCGNLFMSLSLKRPEPKKETHWTYSHLLGIPSVN